MNDFQKFMLNTPKDKLIWSIIKIYHPNLERFSTNLKGIKKDVLDSITVGTKFNWIIINGRGVDIGIKFENTTKEGTSLWGNWVKLEHFEESLKHDKFRTWRFVTDSLYKKADNPDINHLLELCNVPRPTAIQMFDYYYKE